MCGKKVNWSPDRLTAACSGGTTLRLTRSSVNNTQISVLLLLISNLFTALLTSQVKQVTLVLIWVQSLRCSLRYRCVVWLLSHLRPGILLLLTSSPTTIKVTSSISMFITCLTEQTQPWHNHMVQFTQEIHPRNADSPSDIMQRWWCCRKP